MEPPWQRQTRVQRRHEAHQSAPSRINTRVEPSPRGFCIFCVESFLFLLIPIFIVCKYTLCLRRGFFLFFASHRVEARVVGMVHRMASVVSIPLRYDPDAPPDTTAFCHGSPVPLTRDKIIPSSTGTRMQRPSNSSLICFLLPIYPLSPLHMRSIT